MAFAELKERQSVMWGNGPYERITATIRDLQEKVVDRLEPRPGMEWLDAACGTGAAAFLAAERGATVTGLDLAPALIETARELAAQRGVEIAFDVGDAEALPYEDASSTPSPRPAASCSRPTTRRSPRSWPA
jgi:2-polyprenyl-3-methyl-5-hydroxy-6-metoxy-1,4-benzoquinol methylase